MRWAGYVARMGEMRNACDILVGKYEVKRALGKSRCRWEDNIGMDFTEIGWEGVDWIQLAQNRGQWRAVVNTVMKLQVPCKVGNFLTSCVTISFSRKTLLHGVLCARARVCVCVCVCVWRGDGAV
jgi:hypothetical protein